MRAQRGSVLLEGFAGLPTLHRPNSLQLYLIVNGRPVRDKLLAGTVRAAYGDLVPQGRYPMLALFLTLPPEEVDVNVHPAKTELQIPRSERHPLAHHRRAQGHAWRRGSPRYRVPVASSPAAHGDAESPGATSYRPVQPQSGGRSRIRLRRGRASAARSARRAERRYARRRGGRCRHDSLSARRRPRADQRHLYHRRDRGCARHRRSARRA